MKKFLIIPLPFFIILILFTVIFTNHNNHKAIASCDISTNTKKYLLNEGINNLKNQNLIQAIKKFEQLTDEHPEYPYGFYNLALAYSRNQQYQKAINAWEKAKDLKPNWPELYYHLANAYKNIDNTQKALNNFKIYLEIKPQSRERKEITTFINHIENKKTTANIQPIRICLAEKPPTLGTGVIGRIALSEKIDSESNEPIETKKTFNRNVKLIYICIELVNAEANTNVEVKWFYKINGKKIPVNKVQTIAKGSKNIVFSLKKPPKRQWYRGRYEVQVLVNGKVNTVLDYRITS